ncbi:unnamed protein product [Cuscuta campestris]|uniref:Uncharacterized protein n=1 Tax=Cuscuta campestris TaxID=132261 RepID=A0A484NML4_9ASTE|nr:unnamed protein product [Cuscuta campestris]
MAVTQKLDQESLDTSPPFRASDREAIEHYLDDNVELLDACNALGGKLEIFSNYIESIRFALCLLKGRPGFTPSPITVSRADQRLASCESILGTGPTKSVKKVRKKIARRYAKSSSSGGRAQVILRESLIVTSSLFEVVDSTLSLSKSKCRGVKVSHVEKKGVVWELQKTVWLAQELRQDLISQGCGISNPQQVRVIVEELQRSSDELYKGIQLLEGKVREVYGNLMTLRMGLLGKLSSLA